ncbi:M4 family metallopeptidase [Alteromonas lipolytica]|uniref:Bacillolysin n=1 Tax=Alteromonas lipolytica TaxID=1856405 RepID=A0A1E8FH08_9ALTE|nr:M4 family metallopeptidase [Alteromonas lipolytica]OFI35199.1 hypothetical protein BFC17_16800 [Alteromonas lipolytica]GGF57557.1 hypothetical protein GCM10011338_07250 [Alteromonas lipolytica]
MRNISKLVVLVSLALNANSAFAKKPEGVSQLLTDTSGNAKISIDKKSGKARFIRLPTYSPLSALTVNKNKAGVINIADNSKSFLRDYGSAFGIKNVDRELELVSTSRDKLTGEHATFQQFYEGIPVFGGEIRTHYNSAGQLIVVNGNFLSDIKVSTKATVKPSLAAKIAIMTVSKDPAQALNTEALVWKDKETVLTGSELSAKSTKLMVFREGLLKGVPGKDHLVYEVEVTNKDTSVREFIYVDAHSKDIVDQITGIHDALDRRAYDAESQPHPGPNYPDFPFWVEGDAFPTASSEADNMILASEETYSLFSNAWGRDSFDGSGAIMDAIFNRGDSCPNASWNGVYISFCPGLTSDDVTAHEWAHAYTQYTNNLIYQWQSGALNESYSDIWGETVDRINGRDDLSLPNTPRSDGSCSVHGAGSPSVDDSVRWLMGEDTSGFGGAIRDMYTPTCYGDPGKVTDSEYFCSTADSGGVHYNSGVPNHAFALMVDGGSYNGYAGSGLGLTKSAHIHWVAQNLLTVSSNFADHADALEAACSTLIGDDLVGLTDGLPTGEVITAANCAEVAEIIDAVELRTPPEQCGFEPILETPAPALCDGLGVVQPIFTEDFENGSVPSGWTVSMHDVANPSTFDSTGWEVTGDLPTGALGSFAAFAPDLIAGDCAADTEAGVIALDSPVIVLPADEIPHAAFTHWVATEAGWDGGNLKISVNGGPFTVVPSSAYSFNAYNTALSASDNPLAGEEAFTGANEGGLTGSWGQSQIDLLNVAMPGDSVQFRFDFGTDGCNGVTGWYVDDIEAYSCSEELPPVCGDGVLDIGEMCDDGNGDSGDGCSSSCQVESGYSCTLPIPSSNSSNLVGDWSFEAGVPNPDWTPSSTFGGVAGFPLCGPGNGCPVDLGNTGSWMVWIGGLSGGVTSSVSQDITLPVSATEISVEVLRGICAAPDDTITVTIDGNEIGDVVCDATDGDYVTQTFSIVPFNDGGEHTLAIGGTVGTEDSHTNFFVDDVIIEDNMAVPGTPSVCTPVVTEIACNTGIVGFDSGIAPSWTVVDNAGEGIVWTTIADSGVGGNFTGGDGDAATANSDAIPGEFDTELQSNSFSLAGMSSATLEYLVNYQNLAGSDFLNLDISTDGGSTWAQLLSWNEDHPPGSAFISPGEQVSVDLSAYSGETDLKLRWHYFDPNSGDWDWYAQVDNVALSCEEGSQPMQCDINGDNFVDRSDIRLITQARNQPAQPGDPRDNDGNGVINVSDARQCTQLCTLPRCAPAPL